MRWDKQKRRYVDSRGRVIPERQVRKEVSDYVAGEQEKVLKKAANTVEGIIDRSAFFAFLESKIDTWHKITGTIAYGGKAQMTPERWARIERIIESEKEFLAGFKADTAAEILTEGLGNRAAMYTDAAYATFANQELQRERDEGVTLGRRICEKDGTSCDECVSAATEEWVPLDDLEEIGSLQCLNNCRCEFEFQTDGVEFRTSDVFTGVIGGQDQYGGSVTIQ